MDQSSPTLLVLNDFCLMKLFKYLEEWDCMNLANTCQRLRNIAVSVISPKYKKIAVQEKNPTFPFFNHPTFTNKKTKEELNEILSLVGGNVSSFKFIDTSPFIYELLNNVPNLKELKIGDDFLRDQLTDYLTKNNQLESIECRYVRGVFNLLKMLPNLTELRLYDLRGSIDRNQTINGLLSLNGLTRFSFTSPDNCNQILVEIAKELQLVELDVHAVVTCDVFDIIKSFEHLEGLSITNIRFTTTPRDYVKVPENVVLPPRLQRIKFGGIEISCNCFLSIVKNLKLLNEFNIADGYIVDGAKLFPQRMSQQIDFTVIARISNDLREELSKRSLKIIYHDNYNASHKPIFPHNLNLLTIVNSWFDRDPENSGQLITIYEQPKRKFYSRDSSLSSSDTSPLAGSSSNPKKPKYFS